MQMINFIVEGLFFVFVFSYLAKSVKVVFFFVVVVLFFFLCLEEKFALNICSSVCKK